MYEMNWLNWRLAGGEMARASPNLAISCLRMAVVFSGRALSGIHAAARVYQSRFHSLAGSDRFSRRALNALAAWGGSFLTQ